MYFSFVFYSLLPPILGITESDVTFYLFSWKNREKYIRVSWENVTIETNSIVVFIHGWSESRQVLWYENLKNAYLNNSNTTVIQVDWSKSASKFYLDAVYDCSKTGEIIARFIGALLDRKPHIQTHLVGHSLGSHIAGNAGKLLKNSGLRVARITALDPAGFFIYQLWVSESYTLNKSDAEVVVALHTDPWKLGYFNSIGTIDIFPNGRPFLQPGCPDVSGAISLFCSHQRSTLYFVKAVENSGTVLATKCWNYFAFVIGACKANKILDLGAEFDENDAGIYYLRI